MTLSNEDVQDILALLDGLPYSELTLETARFTLTLRRAGDGVWAQETRVTAEPKLADPASASPAWAGRAAAGHAPADRAGADRAGADRAAAGHGLAGPAVPAHDGAHESTTAQGEPVAADGTPASLAGPESEIRAQLPGTFYRAPQPGAPPYVETGSRVEADTVVAIIETMKLMNPVYAGTAGTVAEICLADGQFAEQGTVLMRISAHG